MPQKFFWFHAILAIHICILLIFTILVPMSSSPLFEWFESLFHLYEDFSWNLIFRTLWIFCRTYIWVGRIKVRVIHPTSTSNDDDDAPQPLLAIRWTANVTCRSVGTYGCTTPALVPFCVARLKTICHTGRLQTLPARAGPRLTVPGHHTSTPNASREGFDLPENEFIA